MEGATQCEKDGKLEGKMRTKQVFMGKIIENIWIITLM